MSDHDGPTEAQISEYRKQMALYIVGVLLPGVDLSGLDIPDRPLK